MSKFLKVQGLAKTFIEGKLQTPVLHGIDLEVERGECVAILGASGSGKTTLLQILGGLQRFEAGEVFFQGESYRTLNDDAMTSLREQYFGFVYQFHHLLPELSALENVMLPLMIRKLNKASLVAEAKHILHEVGLSHRLNHKPGELSGGERQRVALARAIVKKPLLLFADEPTGNLDQASSEKVMAYLLALAKEYRSTIIFITHDKDLSDKATKKYKMIDGFLKDY